MRGSEVGDDLAFFAQKHDQRRLGSSVAQM
jgi:hypothetical protein